MKKNFLNKEMAIKNLMEVLRLLKLPCNSSPCVVSRDFVDFPTPLVCCSRCFRNAVDPIRKSC